MCDYKGYNDHEERFQPSHLGLKGESLRSREYGSVSVLIAIFNIQ